MQLKCCLADSLYQQQLMKPRSPPGCLRLVSLWLVHLLLLLEAASCKSRSCEVPLASAATGQQPHCSARHNTSASNTSDSGGRQLPPGVKLVHYALVHTPVKVQCEQLSVENVRQLLPCSADLLQDLPPGLAFRGGVARNLLKAMHSQPEPEYQDCSKLDIDVLALVPDGSQPAAIQAARRVAKTLRLTGRQLGAGDIEVLQQSQLPSYFCMRDITVNEVLLIGMSHSTAMLCYSHQALHDVKLQIARPSVHSLQQAFHMAWDLEPDGTPHVAFPLLRRCLVRLLRGHAASYVLDESSWQFYRQTKLQLHQLFQILRPFQRRDPAALGAVVQHLLASGLLDGRLLLAAGSVQGLWRVALQAASASFGSVAVDGHRLVRAATDVDNVALWELWGQQQVAEHMQSYQASSERTGWMPADESAASLGLLQLPKELINYQLHGPTCNISGGLS